MPGFVGPRTLCYVSNPDMMAYKTLEVIYKTHPRPPDLELRQNRKDSHEVQIRLDTILL